MTDWLTERSEDEIKILKTYYKMTVVFSSFYKGNETNVQFINVQGGPRTVIDLIFHIKRLNLENSGLKKIDKN